MYERVLAELQGHAWVLRQDKLEAMVTMFAHRASGLQVPGAVSAEAVAQAKQRSQPRRAMSVAVLPVFGVLANRANLLSDISGGSSIEQLSAAYDKLVADDTVGAIVLDIESPGGSAAGTMEWADKIYQARGIKPTIAVANAESASGSYWIGSAANEFVIVPSGEVGSVGAFAVHLDKSGANEAMGFKYTYISYGEHKTEGNPDSPLSDTALEHIQEHINTIGQRFEKAVAKYRGVNVATVRKTFGQGQMFMAEQALERKMVDRIDTLENTIARLAGTKKQGKGVRVAHAKRRLETGLNSTT